MIRRAEERRRTGLVEAFAAGDCGLRPSEGVVQRARAVMVTKVRSGEIHVERSEYHLEETAEILCE